MTQDPTKSESLDPCTSVVSKFPTLTRIAEILSSKETPWKERLAALHELEDIVCPAVAGTTTDVDDAPRQRQPLMSDSEFAALMELIAEGLCTQALELRSSMVKRACHTVSRFARVWSDQMHAALVARIISEVLTSLRITVKIIRESIHQCITDLVTFVPDSVQLPILEIIFRGTVHKAPRVRRDCFEFMSILVDSSTDNAAAMRSDLLEIQGKGFIDVVQLSLEKGVVDADADVRTAALTTLFRLSARHPKPAEALVQRLPSSARSKYASISGTPSSSEQTSDSRETSSTSGDRAGKKRPSFREFRRQQRGRGRGRGRGLSRQKSNPRLTSSSLLVTPIATPSGQEPESAESHNTNSDIHTEESPQESSQADGEGHIEGEEQTPEEGNDDCADSNSSGDGGDEDEEDQPSGGGGGNEDEDEHGDMGRACSDMEDSDDSSSSYDEGDNMMSEEDMLHNLLDDNTELTWRMMDFLDTEGVCETLLRLLTRFPQPCPSLESLLPSFQSSEDTSVPARYSLHEFSRDDEHENVAMRRSYAVMRLLGGLSSPVLAPRVGMGMFGMPSSPSSPSEAVSAFLLLKVAAVSEAVLSVFLPKSNGNAHHALPILSVLVSAHPKEFLEFLFPDQDPWTSDLATDESKCSVGLRLFRVFVERALWLPNAASVMMALLCLKPTSDTRPLKMKLFRVLGSWKLFDRTVLRHLCAPGVSEEVSSGYAELLQRILHSDDSVCITESSYVLFQDGQLRALTAGLIEAACDAQHCRPVWQRVQSARLLLFIRQQIAAPCFSAKSTFGPAAALFGLKPPEPDLNLFHQFNPGVQLALEQSMTTLCTALIHDSRSSGWSALENELCSPDHFTTLRFSLLKLIIAIVVPPRPNGEEGDDDDYEFAAGDLDDSESEESDSDSDGEEEDNSSRMRRCLESIPKDALSKLVDWSIVYRSNDMFLSAFTNLLTLLLRFTPSTFSYIVHECHLIKRWIQFYSQPRSPPRHPHQHSSSVHTAESPSPSSSSPHPSDIHDQSKRCGLHSYILHLFSLLRQRAASPESVSPSIPTLASPQSPSVQDILETCAEWKEFQSVLEKELYRQKDTATKARDISPPSDHMTTLGSMGLSTAMVVSGSSGDAMEDSDSDDDECLLDSSDDE